MMGAHADEGMWTLYNLPDAVYQQMQAEGFKLPKSMLYEDEKALKNCVVNFSGYCTGEVVSPMGLVLTNHHCGFEAIRSHSTVEHDYMLNGFFAQELKDELPNENMFVAFMRNQEDVTAKLEALGINNMSDFDREVLIDSVANEMTKQVKKQDSTLYVEIDPFYEGNVYYATTYQRYPDVRLVFTLPKSMGKFGGETDNWMWPRQTCDFSVFRIYVDPVTGGPAKYSEKNVPMQPKAWLQVSTEGYKDGDYTMIMGYPGSTNRYLSSYGIQERRDAINDPMQQVRGVKQQVMKRHMKASEAVRIKYDSKYAQSANYWKNSIGMNKCIDSIGIVNQKKEYEDRIEQWLKDAKDLDEYTKSHIDGLDFKRMAELYKARSEARRAMTFFSETFTRRSNNELPTRLMKYSNGMEVKGSKKKPSKQYVTFDDNSDSWDKALDVEAMAVLMDNYRKQVDKKYLPSFYEKIDKEFGGDYTKYIEAVWDNSIIMKSGVRIPVRLKKKLKKDLGIDMSLSLLETMADIKLVLDSLNDKIADQERRLCAAKVRMEQDMPHYSDANFTMRLTYGQVGGYLLNGEKSAYYTTAQSIVDKMAKADKIDDYKAEPIFPVLLGKDADFGKYKDSVSNTLNLCFLSNNDITGGNSGSPIVDGYGRLLGLAFDGNWDSLSADIFFDKELARTINVDIRYVLYLMKEWGKADRLLKEMSVE